MQRVSFSFHKGSKLVEGLWLRVGHWWPVLLIQFIEVELAFALGTEMVEILYYPLPDALFVEYVFAWQHHGFLHVLVANRTSQIVELVEVLSTQLLQV